jgi:trans-aconitate 2-methyltransferase
MTRGGVNGKREGLMSKWDAGAYLQFSSERTQPAADLAARIDIPAPRRIIDLGCGPGNSTAAVRKRWAEAEIVGLDSSPEMIKAAAESYPGGKWIVGDAGIWTADVPWDIVFSSAALHWLPDHARLFPHLLDQVAPEGALAVQLPALHRSAAHQLILDVAEEPAWRHLMDGPRHAMTKEPPEFYYDVLKPLVSRLFLWETEYYHILDGPRAILEWFRGTGLRPYLAALKSDDQKRLFEERLVEGFTQLYPRQQDGCVLFPFRRLFLIAYRP